MKKIRLYLMFLIFIRELIDNKENLVTPPLPLRPSTTGEGNMENKIRLNNLNFQMRIS